jgi:ABC-type spermidine/putrescine transport system permease subunit II
MKRVVKLFMLVAALFAVSCVTDATEDMVQQVGGEQTTITLSLDDYVIAAYTKPNTFQTISTHIYSLAKGSTVETIKSSYWALIAIIFLIIMVAVIVTNIIANKKVGKKQ